MLVPVLHIWRSLGNFVCLRVVAPLAAMQGIHCNLHTGQERQVLAGAKHVSCTIEMINTAKQWDCAVIDEIQVRQLASVLSTHDIHVLKIQHHGTVCAFVVIIMVAVCSICCMCWAGSPSCCVATKVLFRADDWR